MERRRAVIVSALRTPIGDFAGSLAALSAVDLAKIAMQGVLKDVSLDPARLCEVIFGNVLQAGQGQNPTRQAAIAAGISENIPSYTVNKVCGSGLKAVALAAQAIIAGDSEILLAGGTESMSQAPYLLKQVRTGHRLGHGQIIDMVVADGLSCNMAGCHMGVTAENIVEQYSISREEQDAFAVESHRRAAAAMVEGRFKDELIPVMLAQKKGDPISFTTDEHVRADSSIASLGKLKPAFKKEGSVTAGNASGINDGAAALLVMSEDVAREGNFTPLATIRAYASAGVAPRVMGLGPVPAIRKALEKAGMSLNDIQLIELNEAFAAQSLGVLKELALDPAKVNVNGGAVALGHPIGASGARILVTLLHEMKRRDLQTGLAALCIGGGQGIAMIVERL